jgi:hypothetical protein
MKFETPYGVVEAPNTLWAVYTAIEQHLIPLHRKIDKHTGSGQWSILFVDGDLDSEQVVASCYVGNLALNPLGSGYIFPVKQL